MIGVGNRIRFAIRSRHRGKATTNPARKQRQTLIGGGRSHDRRRGEGLEIRGLEELLADVGPAVGGIGGIKSDGAVVVNETDEACIFHAGLLRANRGPQDSLGKHYAVRELDGVRPIRNASEQKNRLISMSASAERSSEFGELLIQSSFGKTLAESVKHIVG